MSEAELADWDGVQMTTRTAESSPASGKSVRHRRTGRR